MQNKRVLFGTTKSCTLYMTAYTTSIPSPVYLVHNFLHGIHMQINTGEQARMKVGEVAQNYRPNTLLSC